MVDVQCPLPTSLEGDEARDMYNKVRKEMPGLTGAAWRREAARRLGTDYDTFLKAWKKPKGVGLPDPVPPPVGGTPKPPLGKITKKTIHEDKIGTSYSSSIRPAGNTSVAIHRDGELIGYVQRVVEGSYERTSTGIRTHFVIDRRGWVAMDKDGRVLKDGFSAFKYGQDDAIDLVKARAGAVEKIPDPPKPPGSPKPPTPDGPKVLTRDEARRVEKEVAKELGLKPGTAASRRAAADKLGMRYDDYLAAWKGEIPKVPVGDPLPPSYDISGTAAKPPPDAGPVPFTREGLGDHLRNLGIPEHTGGETTGFLVRGGHDSHNLTINWTGPISDPGLREVRLRELAQKLENLGYKVQVRAGAHYPIPRIDVYKEVVWGPTGPVRRIVDGATSTRRLAADKIGAKFRGRFPGASKAVEDELSRQVAYTGDDLIKNFNGVVRAAEDPVDGITFERDNPNVLAYFRGGYHQQIYIPDRMSTNSAFGVRHYSQQRSGWFSKCDNSTEHIHEGYNGLQNTFAHEFGHFIDSQIAKESSSVSKLFDVVSDDLGLSAEEKVQFLIEDKIKSVNVRSKISRKVSKYAATNRVEFFAEVWAEYSRAGVGARPLIQKWGSMIQDIIEGMA